MKKVPTATPSDDRDQRPDQVAAGADAEHADGERGDLGVAHEPQRPEVPELAVPLVERHVVDRADLDAGDARLVSVVDMGVSLVLANAGGWRNAVDGSSPIRR